jgi:hypothetical protein
VTINQAAGQADPGSASPINFTVVFSEPVSGFTGGDVTISGTAGGTKTVTVTGGPSSYNAAVSGMTDGTVIATIGAGVAQDAAGNTNTASSSTDNTVTFKTSAPPAGTRVETEGNGAGFAGSGWRECGPEVAAFSGGIAGCSDVKGDTYTLTFTGNTAVSWLGLKCSVCGIASVSIDGGASVTVDTAGPGVPGSGLTSEVLFSASGLDPAVSHTMVITVTGGGAFIVVDAFDLNGSTTGSVASRFEEASPAISASPTDAWMRRGPEVASFSGGSAGSSDVAEATLTFTFTGTTVSWIGLRCSVCGIATVSIDGGAATSIDTAGPNVPGSPGLTSEALFTASNLAAGSHTMVIAVTGSTTSGGANIIVDAFDVTSGTGSAVNRIEENNPAVSVTGAWALRGAEIAAFSGGTAGSSDVAGATVTHTFTGTAVSWIGLKCSICGIATVSIDGGAATSVDTAGPAAPGSPGLTSEAVFTSPPLATGSHTMVISVTGTTTSSDAHIIVDAFDVTGGTAGAATRVEDTNPAVSYTGAWIHGTDPRASGGTFAEAETAGALATLSFTGTQVRLLGARNSNNGKARVSIDGVFKGEIDTYAPSIEGAVLFTATGLHSGAHSMTVEVTGTRNSTSSGNWVIIDAFDVTP